MQTKRFFLLFTGILATLVPLFADELPPAEAQAALERSDALSSFPGKDLSAEYDFVQDTPGKGKDYKSAVMYRRDDEGKYLIIMKKPESQRGKAYLKVNENNIMAWDPANRSTIMTKVEDRFQGMCIRNSDFSRPRYARDYRITAVHNTRLGKMDCWQMDLKAIAPSASFQSVKVWIDKKENLVRQTQEFSQEGTLMRTVARLKYMKVGNGFTPSSILVVDELRSVTVNGKEQKEKAQITIKDPILDNQDSNIYSQAFLEKMNG